jgi:hypothetical protein
MQLTLSREFITDALSRSILDPKVRALDELCFISRHHLRDEVVADKLRLIARLHDDGMVWRGQGLSAEDAACRLSHSQVDRWFGALATAERLDTGLLLELHKRLMGVFAELGEDAARGLASRYLHFHFPELFPIYDSRIAAAIGLLVRGDCGFLSLAEFDPVYGRFHACCRKLTERIAPLLGRRLSPRELDHVLRAWVDEADYGFDPLPVAASVAVESRKPVLHA